MCNPKKNDLKYPFNYIKENFICPAVILCALCVVGLALIGFFTVDKSKWSFGLVILLLLSAALVILAIVSLIAMYREVSRVRERQCPQNVKDYLDNLESRIDERLTKLEEQKAKPETSQKTRKKTRKKTNQKTLTKLNKGSGDGLGPNKE